MSRHQEKSTTGSCKSLVLQQIFGDCKLLCLNSGYKVLQLSFQLGMSQLVVTLKGHLKVLALGRAQLQDYYCLSLY